MTKVELFDNSQAILYDSNSLNYIIELKRRKPKKKIKKTSVDSPIVNNKKFVNTSAWGTSVVHVPPGWYWYH